MSLIRLDGEPLRYCSDFLLKRALDDIQFELAKREYKKIKEEEKEENEKGEPNA